MILRRIEGSRFSEVLPEWKGGTVAIIGGGQSLTIEQVGMVRSAGVRCIAVNDAYLLADFADVCHAADSHWHRWHAEGIAKPTLGLTAEDVRSRWAAFAGQKCTIQNSGANVKDDAVHMLQNKNFPQHGNLLSTYPGYLATGHNSGFQALNIAVLAGAKTVILIGFDGRPGHFHGGHPRPTPDAAYLEYRRAWSEVAPAIEAVGVRVINSAPGSAVDAFEKMGLEDALAMLDMPQHEVSERV